MARVLVVYLKKKVEVQVGQDMAEIRKRCVGDTWLSLGKQCIYTNLHSPLMDLLAGPALLFLGQEEGSQPLVKSYYSLGILPVGQYQWAHCVCIEKALRGWLRNPRLQRTEWSVVRIHTPAWAHSIAAYSHLLHSRRRVSSGPLSSVVWLLLGSDTFLFRYQAQVEMNVVGLLGCCHSLLIEGLILIEFQRMCCIYQIWLMLLNDRALFLLPFGFSSHFEDTVSTVSSRKAKIVPVSLSKGQLLDDFWDWVICLYFQSSGNQLVVIYLEWRYGGNYFQVSWRNLELQIMERGMTFRALHRDFG